MIALPTPEAWVRDALCAQVGFDEFFPDAGQPSTDAKKVCAACPVLEQCRAYAIADDTLTAGIWGGLSARERQKARSAVITPGQRRVLRPIQHGTSAGERAHRRRGEKPCQPCLDGAALAKRVREEKKTGLGVTQNTIDRTIDRATAKESAA